MHSFSCFFLLHHHFEAVSTSSDAVSRSSGSINDSIMSEESENENEQTTEHFTESISENEPIVPQVDDLPPHSTLNPVDEDSQFIYDEESNRLICVGSSFDEIPQSIVDAFSRKTKILDLSKNHFRSLNCIRSFPNLEELILDDNDLDDDHTRFPNLSNLHTLMLNKNRLQDIYKLVEQLRHAYPMLTHLSLLGNEACPYRIIPSSSSDSNHSDLSPFAQNRVEEEYQRYRHFLIFRIPTLKFLDASEISPNERRIATQLGDILYSIAETKQSQSSLKTGDEKRNETKTAYTPLPASTDKNKPRTSIGKQRHAYQGEGSQGNKFVQDKDL